MTILDLLQQAQTLTPYERKELAKLLIDTLETPDAAAPHPATGAEIVALLRTMDPIEFVDADIADPVEWVAAQRRKRAEKLQPYRDETP